ncbi:MAG: hypothetical protein ACFB51_09850, partial [Anaerolineae bacterium]
MRSTLTRMGIISLLVLFLFSSAAASPAAASTPPPGCVASVEHLSGQGRYAIVGLGRYAIVGLEGDTSATVQDNIIGPSWIALVAPSVADDPALLTEPVVVIVVDDFSVAGASHGYHVLSQIMALNEVLVEAGYPSMIIDTIDYASPPIDHDIAAMASAIDTKIRLQYEDYSRFSLNMSFGALPCEDSSTGFDFFDFLPIFRDNQDNKGGYPEYNLQQFVEDNLPGVPDAPAYLSNLLTDGVYEQSLEPLQDLLKTYAMEDPSELLVVTSASSANFADWLPNDTMAPAR